MPQSMELGNSVQPLGNVARLITLIKRLQSRQYGLPGIAVFFGPPGYGKTFAAMSATVHLDTIHIAVQQLWTRKTLLKQILRELGIPPVGTLADMMMQCNHGLAVAGRTLIIDEADYAVERGMIEVIRDLQDGSNVPIILIGMEDLPQKLRAWKLVDGRIYQWSRVEPADLKDAQILAPVYAQGVDVADDLLQLIVDQNTGNVRRICVDLAYVVEQSNLMGLDRMTRDAWGDAPFLRGDAPAPREGLK